MKTAAQVYKNIDLEKILNYFSEQLQDLRGCL
jgi:hypothetical protein